MKYEVHAEGTGWAVTTPGRNGATIYALPVGERNHLFPTKSDAERFAAHLNGATS